VNSENKSISFPLPFPEGISLRGLFDVQQAVLTFRSIHSHDVRIGISEAGIGAVFVSFTAKEVRFFHFSEENTLDFYLCQPPSKLIGKNRNMDPKDDPTGGVLCNACIIHIEFSDSTASDVEQFVQQLCVIDPEFQAKEVDATSFQTLKKEKTSQHFDVSATNKRKASDNGGSNNQKQGKSSSSSSSSSRGSSRSSPILVLRSGRKRPRGIVEGLRSRQIPAVVAIVAVTAAASTVGDAVHAAKTAVAIVVVVVIVIAIVIESVVIRVVLLLLIGSMLSVEDSGFAAFKVLHSFYFCFAVLFYVPGVQAPEALVEAKVEAPAPPVCGRCRWRNVVAVDVAIAGAIAGEGERPGII
jgi:hypothetical protein